MSQWGVAFCVCAVALAPVPASAGDGGAPARNARAPSLLSPLGASVGAGASATLPDAYPLQRATDGSGDLVYDASAYTARVARDGTVQFRDRHAKFELKLLPFLPGPPPRGVPTLEGVLRGLGRKGRRPAAGPPRNPTDDAIADETRDPTTTFSRYRPDPREICQYPNPCFFDAPMSLVNARVKFDITDELMRMNGQDPYRYEKARFLAATREMRVRLAARAHADDIRHSGAELPARLRAIACDQSLGPAERRAIIEGLRAEIDTGTPEAAAQAAQIQRFLQELDRHDGGAPCTPRRPGESGGATGP